MKIVTICVLAILLLAGFTGVASAYQKEISAAVPIEELSKFTGAGYKFEAGAVYSISRQCYWLKTSLEILNKTRVLDNDAYEIKLSCGKYYYFTGKLIVTGNPNAKLKYDRSNFSNVYRSSVVYIDDNYIVDLSIDRNHLFAEPL